MAPLLPLPLQSFELRDYKPVHHGSSLDCARRIVGDVNRSETSGTGSGAEQLEALWELTGLGERTAVAGREAGTLRPPAGMRT